MPSRFRPPIALIPGLVNSHTHSHGALNRGGVEDKVSLEMFLTGGGASTRSRGIDDKYLSAPLSAAEMIRKGSTACFDFSLEFPAPSVDRRPNHLLGAAGT
jgi:guanine deaminase